MVKVVISQPMFMPWIGLFEQISISDVFVHYDDAFFPMGRSFMNRVQIKTKDGFKWLSVPLKKSTKRNRINNVEISYEVDWRSKYLKFLYENYKKNKHVEEMIDLVNEIFYPEEKYICDFNIKSIQLISNYLGLETKYMNSSDFITNSNSSKKIIEIVKPLKCKKYITGHGALNYLNHEMFEKNNIDVEYMLYENKTYKQLYGKFNPYVSILDPISSLGTKTKDLIISKSINWKKFKIIKDVR